MDNSCFAACFLFLLYYPKLQLYKTFLNKRSFFYAITKKRCYQKSYVLLATSLIIVINMIYVLRCNYSSSIAPVGHTPAHVPQLMQLSASITYCPSPSAIAPTGHSPTHVPQDTQESEILYAIVLSSLYIYDNNPYI